MHVIAVVNNKGGAGKTTTVLNLANAFADMGLRVLAIDNDGQANLTRGLGWTRLAGGEESVPTMAHFYRALFSLDEVVSNFKETLYVAPANQDLDAASMEMSLPGKVMRVMRLSTHLRRLADSYDVCLIDCPPNVGNLTYAALVAATHVLIPTQAEEWSIAGVRRIVDLLHELADDVQADVLGTIATQTTDTRRHHEGLRNLRQMNVPFLGAIPQRKGIQAEWQIASYYKSIAEDIAGSLNLKAQVTA